MQPLPSDVVVNEAVPLRLRFHASGSEYFRIWIVNLLLSLVTLGIYSAWAKVRRNRYFYGSTELDGSSFEYHGRPLAILKGRLIALVIFGGYNLTIRLAPMVGLAMALVIMAVLPWLLWKSLQFKLYNTSYRGIRFGFDGSAGKAYANYLLLPILVSLSCLLAAPWAHQRVRQFQHTESRYGGTHFSFDAGVGSFYKIYGLLLLVALAGAAVFGFAGAALMRQFAGANLGKAVLVGLPAVFLVVLLVECWFLLLLPIFFGMVENLVWNHTRLGAHGFRSELKPWRLLTLYLGNLLGIIFTLGLFIPFAHVRALRYRLESTTLLAQGSLDEFVAHESERIGATGEGMADLLDFDLSM